MHPNKTSPLVRIGVVGIGGAGNNAINLMIAERERVNGIEGGYSVFNEVEIIAANTDAQDLEKSPAGKKMQLGPKLTGGWGAGANPEIGNKAAEESTVDIAQTLEGLDMLFITAGMGGGTGTGASPVVAQIAKEAGILTVAVVTKPFVFEGTKKMRIAQEWIEKLGRNVDTLVIIPNQKLIEIASDDSSAKEMFEHSNVVLIDAVRNIAELISNKSYINVDFADICTIMKNMGTAMIGYGSATGENAAVSAVQEALSNPLLSDVSIRGAKRALLHFGGMNVPLRELEKATKVISDQLNIDADFIWGASVDETADRVFALIVAEASRPAEKAAPAPAPAKKQVVVKENTQQGSIFDLSAPPASSGRAGDIVNDLKDDMQEEALRPAAADDAPAVVAKKVDQSERLNYDEKIIFQVPEDLKIDQNNTNIPAYLRNMVREKPAASSRVESGRSEIDALEKFIQTDMSTVQRKKTSE